MLYQFLCDRSVIQLFLSLLKEQLGIYVIRNEAVVIAPLAVLVSMFAAKGELAPSDLTVLFKLHQLVERKNVSHYTCICVLFDCLDRIKIISRKGRKSVRISYIL